MWEIFNVKMVAAHHAIRWMAGLLPARSVLYLLLCSPGSLPAEPAGHSLRAA